MKKLSKSVKLFKGITRKEAVGFVQRHKTVSNPFGQGTIHVTFPVEEITDFIRDSKLEPNHFLRFYFGRNDDNDRTVIIVGARPGKSGTIELTESDDGNDIIGRDFGTLCPPQCDRQDIGSIAHEVFWAKAKKKQVKRPSRKSGSVKKR